MKIHNIIEGKSENRELWDKIKSKGVVPSFDKEKYQGRNGLEGPFRLRNGKVVYYDPQEGSYYDPDTDMYISYDDYKKMDEQGEAEGQDTANKNQAKAKKAGANLKMDPDTGTPDHFTAAQRRKRGLPEGDKRPGYVVKASHKPKIVKPSMGGESPHPYQGKLVGATESSQWGEPKDVLAQVLQTLEREVEWPLTDVMDPQQVKQLLSPLMQAVSQALNNLDEASVATMRKYFAGDEKAEDPSKTSAMRDFFSNSNNENPIKPSSGPVFRSKKAEVSNTDYEWTHGKKPGGQGSWFFVAHRGGVNFSKDVEGEDYVELHSMSYGDAKKAAVKWAKSKGHTSLFVAT